jgi:cell division septation protein DedD
VSEIVEFRDPAPVPADPTARTRPAPKALADTRTTPVAKPVPVAPTRPAASEAVVAARGIDAGPAPRPVDPGRDLTEPKGAGYVVQVAAVRQRAEATSIARRLSGKGYPAFVTTSGKNFRVRVGKYGDRREADTVASRLKREERFEPWVTR